MLLRLDTFQNNLLVVQCMLDAMMLVTSCGAFIASIFAVNIVNGLENYELKAFWSVFVCLMVFCVFALTGIEKSLKSSGIILFEVPD